MSGSGSGFYVDPDSLRTLATVLQNLGSDLNTIHDGRGQLAAAVVVGEFSVGDFSTSAFDNASNALQNFAGDWSNGIAQLNQESAGLATALNQAAGSYSDTEQKLAQAITPPGAAGNPPTA